MARGRGGTAVAAGGTPGAAHRAKTASTAIDPAAAGEGRAGVTGQLLGHGPGPGLDQQSRLESWDDAGCDRPATWIGEAALPGGTAAALIWCDAAALLAGAALAAAGWSTLLVEPLATAGAYALLGLYRARLPLSVPGGLP